MGDVAKRRSKVSKRLRLSGVTKVASRRQVFGFAYTSVLNGEPVVDHDKDMVLPEELEKAAYNFVANHRVGGQEHQRMGVAHCIESAYIDAAKARGMGLDETKDIGWWIGFQVTDAETWAAVERGELQEFSFGGEAQREPHPEREGVHILRNLVVHEVSLVTEGAGRRVPVAITKERKSMDKLLKLLKGFKGFAGFTDQQIDLISAAAQAPGALDKSADALKPGLEAAGLTEEQMAMVMALFEAARSDPMAPSGPSEVESEDSEEHDDKMEDEEEKAEEDDEEEKAEDEDEDMKKQSKGLAKSFAKMAKDLEKTRAELAKEKRARRLEKARAVAREDYAGAPMGTDDLAKLIVDVEDGKVDKSVLNAMKKAAEITKSSAAFESYGVNGRGKRSEEPSDEWDVLQPIVEKHTSAGMELGQAIRKAISTATKEGKLDQNGRLRK